MFYNFLSNMAADIHATRIVAFTEWLDTNGFALHKGLEIKYTDEFGYGLYATEPFQPDTVLFEVPKEWVLSKSTCAAAEALAATDDGGSGGDGGDGGDGDESMAGDDSWTGAILALLSEETLGGASRWAPYIAMLSQPDVPLFWTDDETADLAPSPLAVSTPDMAAAVKAQYEEDFAPILQKHSELFGPGQSSYGAFLRAGTIVGAYAFTDENEGTCFFPLADTLNATVVGDAHNACLVHSEDDGKHTMNSTRAIKAGEQVFNTYGDLDNASLLGRYGYVERFNPHDRVDLDFAAFAVQQSLPQNLLDVDDVDGDDDDSDYSGGYGLDFSVGMDLEVNSGIVKVANRLGAAVAAVAGGASENGAGDTAGESKANAEDDGSVLSSEGESVIHTRVAAEMAKYALSLSEVTKQTDALESLTEALTVTQRRRYAVLVLHESQLTLLNELRLVTGNRDEGDSGEPAKRAKTTE